MKLLTKLAGLGLICVVALTVTSTHAHEGRPLFLELEQQSDKEFKLSWRLPPKLMDGAAPLLTLEANTAQHCVASSRAQLGPKQTGWRLYHCGFNHNSSEAQPDSPITTSLMIQLDYAQANPGVSTLLRVRTLTDDFHSEFFPPEQHTLLVDLTNKASNQPLWTYLKQGILHIAGGYDHLLFVACLMFIAGSFRRVLVTVTGFTIAHSVTLVLATLNLVTAPITAIEASIALSIAFLAAEISKEHKSGLTWKYPVIVAMLFGLLHGFGFASALSEIGLPDGERIEALLLFNLGVELGQILFVLLLAPLLFVVRKATASSAKIIAYPIGVTALFWTFQRIFY